MMRVVPHELRWSFCDLLKQLDGTGDDRADYTRIFCMALLNELKTSADRGETLRFINTYGRRSLS
jgi:hypothetical protein